MALSLTARAPIISDYGIKFGAVSSTQIFEGSGTRNLAWEPYLDGDWKRRLGPQIGLFVQFLNSRHFTLQTEVSYLQKGVDEEIHPTLRGSDGSLILGESYTLEISQFDYITFSILAQPKIPLNQIELYMLAGPALNILISNREWPFKDAADLTPGIVIGGGLEFRDLFEFPFFIEIRYNPDLQYFFENEYIKSKFQIWQLLLGVKLKR
jgi:hypothetical protein